MTLDQILTGLELRADRAMAKIFSRRSVNNHSPDQIGAALAGFATSLRASGIGRHNAKSPTGSISRGPSMFKVSRYHPPLVTLH